jgi:type 1 glutamine amidotransferase
MGKHWSLLVVPVLGLLLAGALPGRATAADTTPKIRVLVIAGGHPYSVKPFRAIFAGYPDMECTFVEEKQGGEAFDNIANWHYDAIVLYNYMKKPSPEQWQNFLQLLDRGTGLVIWHHAIYGYRPVPEFQKIVGVTRWLSGAKDNFDMKIHVEDPDHPITRGLKDFSIKDEVYQGHVIDPKVHVLLTTDQPANTREIAWTHTYRKSPVCYIQLGHGPSAYGNAGLTTFLGSAIRWSAARLPAAPQPAK